MPRRGRSGTRRTLDVASVVGGTAGAILIGGGSGVAIGSLAKGAANTQVRMNASGTAFAALQRPDFIPSDLGYLAWAYDPACVVSTATTTSGVLQLVKIHAPEAMSVTNVALGMAAGGTITANQAFAGVYQGTSLLGSTADQSGNWSTGGLKVMAISGGPIAVAAGDFFVGFFWAGAASPTFTRSVSGAGATFPNNTLASPNLRFSTSTTGLTTALPNPFGAQTASGTAFWAAVS